jgi:glyoxylate utilization-related uncharacterized protein
VNVTRFSEAKGYVAANHHGCEAVRLQGVDVSPVTSFWLGVYLVLEGEVTVEIENESVTLHAKDSVFLAANERRRIINESDTTAVMAVMIAPST